MVELPRSRAWRRRRAETVADVHALRAVLESEGEALSATDAEILDAQSMLGQEGLCVEPSSALPVACLPRLLATGKVSADDDVVCCPDRGRHAVARPARRAHRARGSGEPDTAAVDRYLERVGLGGREG